MKSRAEVVKLIESQLNGDTDSYDRKNGAHHYGYQELRELLDFIYEGKPSNIDEFLINSDPRANDDEYVTPYTEEMFNKAKKKYDDNHRKMLESLNRQDFDITQDDIDKVKEIVIKPNLD